LFEAQPRIGGQLRLACRVPGKEEFSSLLTYYRHEVDRLGIELRLTTPLTAAAARDGRFDRIVFATGVSPRRPRLAGLHHGKVCWYPDVLTGSVVPGARVAIIGAGAIAFDVAEYLTSSRTTDARQFFREWGVTPDGNAPGAIAPAEPATTLRTVHLFQRTPGRPAARLGISTGWILRTALQRRSVTIVTGCEYQRMDEDGLHYTIDEKPQFIAVDNVVVCAGQESAHPPANEFEPLGVPMHWIGGARDAIGIDARRAIEEGYRLALEC
jgi:2,4-dienoyl-CoA reductase (NADPH2)